MDKLTIQGVANRFDGDYDCDVRGMLINLTSPEALTGDEACFIQDRSKVRGGELGDAFDAGDVRFLMALAVVVLQRHGKTMDPEMLMGQRIGTYRFVLETQEVEPAHPTVEGEPSQTSSPNGGTGSETPSESPAVGLRRIGAPV